MVPAHPLKLNLILTLATLSCGLLTPVSNTPTSAPVTETSVPPTHVPATSALTADMIRNAQYQLGALDSHPVVQLANGEYLQGTDPGAVDYASVFVSDPIALGDVNGDGVNEAAVVVFENFGGTGNFAMLTLFRNENGVPVFVTSTMIDDRPIINGLTFDGNEIHLDATVHGIQDPACCPALPSTRRYTLVNDQLRLTHLTTSAPTGDVHEIEITSPTNGTEVTSSVQVTGGITISPFENNLGLRIFDTAGIELFAGPLQVTAPDLGAPGIFDAPVDLTGIPSGTAIIIEVQDISMADGSLIAMDSVQLVVQ